MDKKSEEKNVLYVDDILGEDNQMDIENAGNGVIRKKKKVYFQQHKNRNSENRNQG